MRSGPYVCRRIGGEAELGWLAPRLIVSPQFVTKMATRDRHVGTLLCLSFQGSYTELFCTSICTLVYILLAKYHDAPWDAPRHARIGSACNFSAAGLMKPMNVIRPNRMQRTLTM